MYQVLTVIIGLKLKTKLVLIPDIITLDHKSVSAHDLLYSIGYADWEDEDMHLNFTFSPNNGIYNGILIFECDTFGNYYGRFNIQLTLLHSDRPKLYIDIVLAFLSAGG